MNGKHRRAAAAALLAALLLGLSACADEAAGTPDDPQQTEPEDPAAETPAQPDDADDADGTEAPDDTDDTDEPAAEAPAADVTPMGQDDWSVPSVTLGDAAAADAETTINDYYDTVADKYGGLASDGADGFSADYTVTYNQGRVLSVRRTVREGEHGALTLYAETFNTEDGGLLVAADFFTVDEADWTDRLIELVTAQLASQSALALTNGWEDSVRAAFDRDSFYLTDTGYVVFYPAGTVASGAAPLEIEIPYEDIADIFAMP